VSQLRNGGVDKVSYPSALSKVMFVLSWCRLLRGQFEPNAILTSRLNLLRKGCSNGEEDEGSNSEILLICGFASV